MTAFWLVAAVLAAAVLVLLLRALLKAEKQTAVSRPDANIAIYRDQLRELDADLAAGLLAQADYERARRELEARALQDAAPESAPAARGGRALAWGIGAALPVLALAVYVAVGNPGAISPQPDEHAAVAHQLDALIARLAARLREQPDDIDGWKLLGRSYVVLGRFPEAADAYAKAAARAPRDAQLLADLADALAMAQGQQLAGEPEKLIARALEIDPKNLKALALAGTAAFARKDYAGAARQWEKMLPLVPSDSEDAREIRANVQEARALAGKPTLAEKPAAVRQLRGTVAIAPNIKGQASPDDTVFVFARAAEGPAMPLAVRRLKVRELPSSFTLDDSMAMAPGMSLSSHPRVVVVARVSRSGKPVAQPGDLQGASSTVANDAQGIAIVIDTVVR